MTSPESSRSPQEAMLRWSWQTGVFVFASSMLCLSLALYAMGMGQNLELIPGHTLPRFVLLVAIVLGGAPLIWELVSDVVHGKFGSDLLAAISIATSLILGEYLAGTIVVMMLSGGQALEQYAVGRASSVLAALARRMPREASKLVDGQLKTVSLDDVHPDDSIVIGAHAICPVDGIVTAGHGSMDESYLSGEPYTMSKSVGSEVISGAINGESVLTVRVVRRAGDSRYAKIMQVMQDSAQRKPSLRRLGDLLGAWYTPLALVVALAAWWFSGDVHRFLAVLVVATPCPLLLGIPIAVIGTISLAARRSIIVKDPAVLEQIALIKTALFDKTGTLTYGHPQVSEIIVADDFAQAEVLSLAASLEQYSRHPLSAAVVSYSRGLGATVRTASAVAELPGNGLRGEIDGRQVWVTSRKLFLKEHPEKADEMPKRTGGLECLIVVEDRWAAILRFRDEIRQESSSFIRHLLPKHGINRVLLVSGDREEEVRYLADQVGCQEVFAAQSPEQKVEITRRETAKAPTMFVGDGINDAPALAAATIGIAFGTANEVTSEAADIVMLESSLIKVDELLHIGQRMRTIALQSAVGGMALSMGGMLLAALGYLPPIAGAILQEVIDVVAILNALRAAWPPSQISDA